MTRVAKFIPWLLCALCGLTLVLVWHSSELKLAQKDAEISDLRGQYNKLATESRNKIHLANQPEVSVRVSFRKALLSSGHVAMISNTSGGAIPIVVEIAREADDRTKRFELVIDGGRRKEIGEMEGWAFVPGDTLRFSQAGHKSVTFTVP